MARLLLVRHARPQADPDVPARLWPLSDAGRESCGVLAERLRAYNLARIVTSAEPKAVETGRLVADTLHLPLAEQVGLHEHDRDGEPFFESRAFEAKIAALFARPENLIFGKETAAAATHRFRSSLERALDRHAGESIAVISHGTVISLFVASVTDTDGLNLWRRLGMPSYVVLALPAFELVEVVAAI